MEHVVPGVLQRLRATDIIRMAGLTVASLGQEYSRTGAVHSTQRQEARISGVVDGPHIAHAIAATASNTPSPALEGDTHRQHYPVWVEVTGATTWKSACPCSPNAPANAPLCAHAAALLYQWLAHPSTFALLAPDPAPYPPYLPQSAERGEEDIPFTHDGQATERDGARLERPPGVAKPLTASRGPAPLLNVQDIVAQLSLSDLRTIAREYDAALNGAGKQQLVETILSALREPETIRRVAATLEKPPRQLLAALTLAGGSMSDDDLRGVYERFSLGVPNQLQTVLAALQNKGFLFRTSLNSSPQQRIGLSGALLDVGWYVPMEVRTALRVSVPVTPFDFEKSEERHEQPTMSEAEPYALLADLLLVARALDGYRLDEEGEEQGSASLRSSTSFSAARMSGTLAADGSIAIPPPADMPSSALLSALGTNVSASPVVLRFAVRLLRLADLLHKDDGGTPYLRMLAHTAQLLLGPARADVLRDLFELWLTQSSYEELFDLREDRLRLRCRTSSLNHPLLRIGELEAENSEARQALVALLAQAPLNQWITFASFARFVYRLNPAFLQKRQRLFSLPHWWIEYEEGRPLRPLQLNDWLRAEYFYLARLIQGPLFWWGACDLVTAHDGRLLAFRLTPVANWLLHGVQTLSVEERATMIVPPEKGAITNTPLLEVDDNGDLLVASSAHSWPLLQVLEEFAQPAGVRDGRLCYRLTPRTLSTAISNGHQPARLLAFLRSFVKEDTASDAPLPRTLAQVERWLAAYGRVRIYTGVALLEAADPLVMRELTATTSVEEHMVQSIHPTLHILKKPGVERIIDELKHRGQAPLLHDEEFYGAD